MSFIACFGQPLWSCCAVVHSSTSKPVEGVWPFAAEGKDLPTTSISPKDAVFCRAAKLRFVRKLIREAAFYGFEICSSKSGTFGFEILKVLNRSHFMSRGLEEHFRPDRHKESEAYIKKVKFIYPRPPANTNRSFGLYWKQANKTYPVKSRLLEERGKTDVSDEDKISHLCSSGRSSRPEVKVQTSWQTEDALPRRT